MFCMKNQENGVLAEKGQERDSNGTRQKNKIGDRYVESNDSPKIPDRGEVSDITQTCLNIL